MNQLHFWAQVGLPSINMVGVEASNSLAKAWVSREQWSQSLWPHAKSIQHILCFHPVAHACGPSGDCAGLASAFGGCSPGGCCGCIHAGGGSFGGWGFGGPWNRQGSCWELELATSLGPATGACRFLGGGGTSFGTCLLVGRALGTAFLAVGGWKALGLLEVVPVGGAVAFSLGGSSAAGASSHSFSKWCCTMAVANVTTTSSGFTSRHGGIDVLGSGCFALGGGGTSFATCGPGSSPGFFVGLLGSGSSGLGWAGGSVFGSASAAKGGGGGGGGGSAGPDSAGSWLGGGTSALVGFDSSWGGVLVCGGGGWGEACGCRREGAGGRDGLMLGRGPRGCGACGGNSGMGRLDDKTG